MSVLFNITYIQANNPDPIAQKKYKLYKDYLK